MPNLERIPVISRKDDEEKTEHRPTSLRLVYDAENPDLGGNAILLEKQKLRDNYLAVADIYSQLETMTRSRKMEAELTPEEKKAIERIIEKYVELKPLINTSLDQVRSEFTNLVLDGDSEKIGQHATRYAEYAVEAETDLVKEKAHFSEVYATPERFHGPEDGEVTMASPKSELN